MSGSNSVKENPYVKTSHLAIASFILALLSCFLFCFFYYIGRGERGRAQNLLILAIWITISWAAIILGVISLVQIGLSAGRLVATGFAVIGAVLPFAVYVLLMFIAIFRAPRMVGYASRNVCGWNLSGIGKAMLIYANDYEDQFPRAGGKDSTWQPKIQNWQADNLWDAFDINETDGTGGHASISSSFYLLVKYAEVMPKSFVCKGEGRTTEFKLRDYINDPNVELIDVWDFGPNPAKHCSYTYHIPYGPYALTTSYLLGVAVAADRNPWIKSLWTDAKDFKKFDPSSSNTRAQEAGNSFNHQGDGQNVLFMDGHVEFARRAYCGVKDDNIYTSWDGSDRKRGRPPTLTSQPADRLDSLLVHDPPVPEQK